MARHRYAMTRVKRERWISEGRGRGEGKDYKPWLTVRDVPSTGRSSRIKGWKTGRVHHLLSHLELKYFYHLEWSDMVIDIREQFPLLPLKDTLAIASSLGIKHPTDSQTKESVVLTTDFMVTIRKGNRKILTARTVKPDEKLVGRRVEEKLYIEKVFYRRRNIDWGVVTENGLSETLARNVGWVHPCYRLPEARHRSVSDEDLAELIPRLTEQVLASGLPLAEITKAQDERMNLRPGSSLFVARHLIATKRWEVDMKRLIHPNEPLILLGVEQLYEPHK